MADNNIPGALMLDIQGQKLSMEERQLLSRQAVGGVILSRAISPNRGQGPDHGNPRIQAGDSAGG